jgi:tripartite-type tricarboxylate transporter receptor subunit TctC
MLSVATVVSAAQGGESFPTRPLRVVVPYAPGGSATLVARHIGQRLTENLGQSVIIDNRGGGNGKIAAEAVARANADGYTLLFGETGVMAINATLFDRAGSHPVKDFTAIGQVVTLDNAVVAHPSAGMRNLRDLVSKAAAGSLTYASSGTGSVGHLATELLKSTLRIKVLHIPYKGGGPAIIDVVGGQVPLLAITVPTAMPYVQSNRLVPLTVLGSKRVAVLPDVPTVEEQGYPAVVVTQWYGYFAPTGIPARLVQRLHAEITRAVEAPEVTKALVASGSNVATSRPEVFAKLVREDVERWRTVIRDAGIQAN